MNSQMSLQDVVVDAVNAGVDMLVTSNKRTDNFEDRYAARTACRMGRKCHLVHLTLRSLW